MLGKINILVHGSIEEDADDYMGAIIEDYNEAEGILHLFVDPDDIDALFAKKVDCQEYDFWGMPCIHNFEELDIIRCHWEGHSIINYENVCWELLKHGDETTWH